MVTWLSPLSGADGGLRALWLPVCHPSQALTEVFMAVDKNLQRDTSIDAELSGTTVYLLWLYLLWLYLPWLQYSHCGYTH